MGYSRSLRSVKSPVILKVDGLFEQLVASVNEDAEIAKLRSSMSHILRKPGDSVQTPLYRLKTCYEMLLQINYPDLELEKIKIMADNYCCNCVKFLISPNTAKIIAEYVTLKQQRGEHLNKWPITGDCGLLAT